MKELFKEITLLLSKGELQEATERLEKLKISKLSREETHKLASLARRVGHPELAIRLLVSAVHPKGGRAPTANDAEKSTYAGALIKLGAIEEALDVIKSIDAEKTPEALLFRAHASMFQWNYAEAIPYFSRCLQLKNTDETQRIFVKLNLAACYVAELQLVEATKLLEELRLETESQNNKVAQTNALELSAQCAFSSKDWKAARNFLDLAEKQTAGVNTIEAFFIRKWRLLTEMNDTLKIETKLSELESLRAEALRLKHWESVRDCDFWKALKTRDTALMRHVYYGTPYDSYRKRIFLQYPEELSIPDIYDWNLEEPGKEAKKKIDVFTRVYEPSSPFSLKSLSYKLLTHLVSDFYRPFRLGVMHAKLYPNDYYNPDSSPVKVYQTIKVLRKGFDTLQVPLDIIDTQDGYRLSSPKGHALLVPRITATEDADNEMIALEKKFGGDLFSAPDVERVFGISRSSVNRLIKRGIDQKVLTKEGHGYSVQYRFLKRAKG